MSVGHWWQAFRPKTLSAAVVPVVVATALVFAEGYLIDWSITVFALLSALMIQIGTNLINDAIDFKKGADREDRMGPVRVTQKGLISPRWVMIGGLLSFLLAIAFGVPLVIKGGWVIVAIGVLSLILGYAYTGGPFPLAYKGWGDIFVVLFFGLVAVGGVFYLHTGEFSSPVLVAGIQVGFLATVLIAINNLRDRNQDLRANKKTLAVRFGESFARYEILFLFALSFLLLGYWWERGYVWATLLPLLSAPVAWLVTRDVWRTPPGPVYNSYLARSSLVHILFGLQMALGLVLR